VAARTPTDNGSVGDAAVREVAREVSSLQAELLAKLHREMGAAESGDAFAVAAQELAKAFGSVSASAVGALASSRFKGEREQVPGLHRSPQMRRRLDQLIEAHRRYGHPFALLVIDVEGPGARGGDPEGGRDTVLAVVGAALRDSVRLVDETYQLEENGLCVLAPNQTTVGGVQMAERLLSMLDELEAAGGLPIGISAGVVACPEHGTEAEVLLHEADEAMWRARAVGQPVGVGALRSLQDR
jgi:diguanylate cyclase (GGDEF)-like protein